MASNSEASATPGPRKTPIAQPLPDCVPAPRPDLTADQQTKYESLLEKCTAITAITCNPKTHASKSGPITTRERSWLTRECLLRYLRATKWSVDDAHKRLLSTLAWRREYGLEGFTPEYISPEQETGKELLLGFDKQGKPCHYLTPNRQNTDASDRQVHHLFYMVERVVELMPPGVEMLSLLINFKPSKKRENTSVGISMAREVLSILQNHYPERLGKALIINVPWVVWGFFKLINPFMDPITREKLKFNEDMKAYVPPAQLWRDDWGGDLDFEYDHEVYWPALNELCRQRREDRFARWEAAGAKIGESEFYMCGGTDTSVDGFKYDKEEAGKDKPAAVAPADSAENGARGELDEKLGDLKLDAKEGGEAAKIEQAVQA